MTEHGLPGRPFKLVDEARRILEVGQKKLLREYDHTGESGLVAHYEEFDYGSGERSITVTASNERPKEEPKPMPEIGGSSFAASLKEIIGGLRREMDEIKGETAKAVEDFREQVVAAREVPKRIRAETQVLRDGINELLGNQPPSGS